MWWELQVACNEVRVSGGTLQTGWRADAMMKKSTRGTAAANYG